MLTTMVTMMMMVTMMCVFVMCILFVRFAVCLYAYAEAFVYGMRNVWFYIYAVCVAWGGKQYVCVCAWVRLMRYVNFVHLVIECVITCWVHVCTGNCHARMWNILFVLCLHVIDRVCTLLGQEQVQKGCSPKPASDGGGFRSGYKTSSICKVRRQSHRTRLVPGQGVAAWWYQAPKAINIRERSPRQTGGGGAVVCSLLPVRVVAAASNPRPMGIPAVSLVKMPCSCWGLKDFSIFPAFPLRSEGF